jgi:hypothetical protein
MAALNTNLRMPDGKLRALPWREDPKILQRLERVRSCMGRNLTTAQIAEEIGVSIHTVEQDRKRLLELTRESNDEAQLQHEELHRQMIETLKVELETGAYNPQARAQMFSVLQRTLDTYSKIAGAQVQRIQSNVTTDNSAAEKLRRLESALVYILGRYLGEDRVEEALAAVDHIVEGGDPRDLPAMRIIEPEMKRLTGGTNC